MIETFTIDVTVSGADGSATGVGLSVKPVSGKVLSVHVDYTTEPSTCDVVLSTKSAPTRAILTLTDANTDGWFSPRMVVHDGVGAAVTYDGTNEIYEPIPVDDHLAVTVAGGNAGRVVLTVQVER